MPDMRFAPPNPLRIADRATGLNAVSVRSYNERLLLSLLLQNEGITRLEIGEKTGLSAQTISVLLRSLEQEGLVSKGKALREQGRVGPPTIPVALNPDGAYSVGISIGHKNTEIVLVNFVGEVRFHAALPNPSRSQNNNHPQFLETIQKAIAMLPKGTYDRLAGVGLALPETGSVVDSEEQAIEQKYAALQDEIESEIGFPVFVQNDITATAGGESMFGAAKPLTDYLFFYLGAELHTRLVLNHQIYNGNSALSFDVGILNLERALHQQGVPTAPLWDHSSNWPDYGQTLKIWQQTLNERLSQSCLSLTQFVEVDTIILSSSAPPDICQTVCRQLQDGLPGITAIAGNLYPAPKAVGAASLPFSSRFMVS
uniref:ROK family transcriptional regulator n=1 Tax=Pararhizobium sp. IMCC3301 TaxID=3067904 RepID=UPI002741E20A|nr:ROK family transcriptional regulator [Pararhizobium sp. IMCC3301]